MNWQAVLGKFRIEKKSIFFVGETLQELGSDSPSVGNFISDQRLSSGSVSARIRFDEITPFSACELLLFYQPSGPAFLTAGLGGETMFSVRSFYRGWNHHGSTGDRSNLLAGRDYSVMATVVGSRLTLAVDGVDVVARTLPFVPTQGQVGIWCRDVRTIRISDFKVSAQKPRAFVVMEYSKPYNELYSEVIKPICEAELVEAPRADDTFGPGLIVADIARQIAEAHLVIAEISPTNPNVYYEVGYAHALNKPTILIAESGTQLPFDIRPFRTLFYENTIEGKRRVEEGFRMHLRAILSSWFG